MANSPEIEQVERRQNRIEDAIDKLTEISADLNKNPQDKNCGFSHL